MLRRLETLTRNGPVRYGVRWSLFKHHAVQFTRLRLAGTPMDGNNLWIACHALAADCKWTTNNTREFERVMGLIPIPNKNDNCVTLPCRAKALSAASRLVLVSIENWNEA